MWTAHSKSVISSSSKRLRNVVARWILAIALCFSIFTVAAAANDSRLTKLKCTESGQGAAKTLDCIDQTDVLYLRFGLVSLSSKDVLPTILAVFAIALSLLNFLYTSLKDKRARRLSIEDDFWIRSVLEPIAIEPLITGTLELVHKLPVDCLSKQSKKAIYLDFILEFQPRHQQLTSAAHAFALLSDKVRETVLNHLDKIEDLVLEFCAANAANKLDQFGNCEKARSKTQVAMREQMLEILKEIKAYQVAAT